MGDPTIAFATHQIRQDGLDGRGGLLAGADEPFVDLEVDTSGLSALDRLVCSIVLAPQHLRDRAIDDIPELNGPLQLELALKPLWLEIWNTLNQIIE